MRAIKFKQNWNNKLRCASFSTIRPAILPYKVFERYKIFVDGQCWGIAECLHCRRFMLQSLTEPMALIDTGYALPQAYALLKQLNPKHYSKHGDKAPFYFIVLSWIHAEQKRLV